VARNADAPNRRGPLTQPRKTSEETAQLSGAHRPMCDRGDMSDERMSGQVYYAGDTNVPREMSAMGTCSSGR